MTRRASEWMGVNLEETRWIRRQIKVGRVLF